MELINQGKTAEIFSLGNDRILKLFRKWIPVISIEEEMMMTNLIQNYNLPIPKFFGKIEYNERIGLIYEYIKGQTLSQCTLTKPWALFSYAKKLAEIHSTVHKVKIEDIPGQNYRQKFRLQYIINHTDKLTDEIKKRIIDFLYQLPDGHSLCHGDLNFDNIVFSGKEPVVIDWMSATSGNPAGDVARTIVLLKYNPSPSNFPIILRIIAKIYLSFFCDIYLNKYIQLTGMDRNEIKQWLLPVAAASLLDSTPPEETKTLLNFIHWELKNSK